MRRVAVLVAQAAPPEAVFAAVAAEAGRLLGVDAALLSQVRPAGHGHGGRVVAQSRVPSPPTPVGSQFPLGGDNLTTLVFRTGQAART